MKAPTEEIERLNWAASAELISRSRWVFSAFNLALGGHAIWSSMRIGSIFLAFFIVGIVVATAAVWTKWRFKFYVSALSYIALALWTLLLIGKTHDKLYFWIPSASFWGFFGYSFWKMAGIVATVQTPGWEKERSQVKTWWHVLMSTPKSDDAIEFSWLCYTFRLLKSGQYWAVVVAVKHWRTLYQLGFAVRKLDEVQFLPLADGKMEVRIGKRTMRARNVSLPNVSNL